MLQLILTGADLFVSLEQQVSFGLATEIRDGAKENEKLFRTT